MITLQQLSYRHSNKELLFSNINLTLNKHDKIALIGDSGVGKSTLLKVIATQTSAFDGKLQVDSRPYYVPQIFGHYNHLAIAQALGIEDKLRALRDITDGRVTQENLDILQGYWGVEERCREALSHWNLEGLHLFRKLDSSSGGQKTRVFLAGISIHDPQCFF